MSNKLDKRIRELVPSLMELSFGCEVMVTIDDEYKEKNVISKLGVGFLGIEVECERYDIEMIKDVDFIEVIGHPIQLQHILLAIEKSGNYGVQIRRMTADGNIQMYTSEGIYITNRAVFNLSKSYNDQEEEVHKFLAEILNIDINQYT